MQLVAEYLFARAPNERDSASQRVWIERPARPSGLDVKTVLFATWRCRVRRSGVRARQPITFQGVATAVKKKNSRRGNDYTLFKLQGPGGCGTVDVFIWGHPKLSDGDHVRVEGVFETVHHQDQLVFYNQVEATKIVPVLK
jgi:hypothetical protein